VSATIREIVDAALTVVGEVSGAGVQQYEDDRMFQDAIRAFNMMFKKYEWPQYLSWFTVVLDGILGIPTTGAFGQIKDFEDFIVVFRDGESSPLPIMRTRTNPSSLGLTGTQALFWTSMNATNVNYALRKLQFYPVTSIGSVQVLAKVYPLLVSETQFDWADVFYLDKDLLVYATAYMTLSGDDLNAGAADVVKNLMEMKYKDVMAALSKHPIPISSRASIPSYWSERY
jgi:hypothetical protein